ncbi:glycoside hydrolase family 13 protein [Flavobacterium sp. W21_SRS_FM6]|uniref:glycoside hydrolase family 13 protein n=1 Tax=Flavobacterium sp. W21_SRS_FM6 TaxID=3240268 RepID=UPI003F93B5EF
MSQFNGYFRMIKSALLYGLITYSSAASATPIERVEPLFWWTGMANQQVQLMVYGENIGRTTVTTSYSNVTILNTEQVDNPNYLFVTLDIAPDTQPGQLTLEFYSPTSSSPFRYLYELKAREAGSAERQGFNQSDAIYLLVPDRFANGDPTNDASKETLELPNRSEPNGRHGGDIQGISNALSYLHDMGFTQIWSTPLTENNSGAYSYHGYAATDLYRIDPRFGNNATYRDFVSKAKVQGIGVIKDIVLNHIGIEHWWMKDVPDANWINNNAAFSPTNHARQTVQDPYSANIDKSAFVAGWFVPTMPDLNQQHPLLATYLIQNSIWWIEYAGLSGIREDTYSYADKTFLSQWANSILNEYPNFTMVGEEWSANPLIVAYWQQDKTNIDGYEGTMPSMMDFPNYYGMLAALNEEESWDTGWIKLYQSLANDGIYPDPTKLVLFEGNHDTARLFSLLDEDVHKFAQAMVLMTTLPRIPQFFYGTEILMQSPKQRDDGLVRSDFPGGWDEDARSAFTGQGLSAQQRQAQSLLSRLLNYRKNNLAISHGSMTHFFPQDGVYSYVRGEKHGSTHNQLWVFLSKNDQPVALDSARYEELAPDTCLFTDVLSGQQYSGLNEVSIPARAWLMLECQPK